MERSSTNVSSNYLAANPEMLVAIQWRQFEGLAAEWLRREGYDVDLGPGRNDGGVDVPGVHRSAVAAHRLRSSCSASVRRAISTRSS